MVGSLMYLTASRPDLVFAVCMRARYQASPTKKHLEAVKWVFWYLQGTINMGLWYPKDTTMTLTAYANADHADNMADMNIPAEQAPTIAPPTRMDDQILPLCKWLPIGKSNCVLDVQKAFTSSSTIHAIYIQQFWDTMHYESTTGLYRCQLDEEWFNLHKDILRDALDITPINDNNPFVAPPSSDTVIEYVNTLGYPCMLRNISAMFEEFVQSIQTFLTDKKNLATASRGKKKSTPLLIPSIRFTKLIIHHQKTKHNIHPRDGSPLHYSHEDHVLGTLMSVGKDGREVFGMPIPEALLTDAIKRAPYYGGYLSHVAEYQRHLDVERNMAEEEEAPESLKATKVTKPAKDKDPKPTSSQPPKPKPVHTKPSKVVLGKKRKLVKETSNEPSLAKRLKGGLVGKRCKPKSPLKLVDEFVDEGVPVKEPAVNEEEANIQRALELSLKELEERTQGPARLVVFREPDSRRFQPLLEVQGKGKENVIEEQTAHDLLTLQTPKKKSPGDQFIF
ncbi:retrovirus-related pol polyprotein from transposon TNT 1-94 [Tanacetum coccineum]